MDEETIDRLKSSFAEVARHRDEVAALFYERLFVADPGLRRLFFRSDPSIQGTKLMATLALIINNLSHLEAVRPTLRDLAIRHVGYGVQQAHYQTLGDALIQTLALFFADRFTPELRAAWRALYRDVSDIMIAAAYQPETRARDCGAAQIATA